MRSAIDCRNLPTYYPANNRLCNSLVNVVLNFQVCLRRNYGGRPEGDEDCPLHRGPGDTEGENINRVDSPPCVLHISPIYVPTVGTYMHYLLYTQLVGTPSLWLLWYLPYRHRLLKVSRETEMN